MKGQLASVTLRVSNPQALANWYQNVLGMSIKHEKSQWTCYYQESKESACLNLIQATNDQSKYDKKASVYWKIGLALSDVDLARDKIMSRTITVSQASQFLDIGYLCHLNDEEGFPIELLQHTFKQNFVKRPLEETQYPLGQKGRAENASFNAQENNASMYLF